MHINWNHPMSKALTTSVAALLATTSLYAIPQGPCDVKPQVCCEEPKPGPFAFSYPFDMNISCPRDFYVHVDGLAFQAKEEGLDFAIANGTGVANLPLSNGEVMGFSSDHDDWDYNPGMRVGIGFYLDHDCWNVDFNWTWVNITNYENAYSGSSTGILVPQLLLGDTTGGPDISNKTAGAKWDSSYNTLDLKLAKPYYVSRYVVFSPHFGVRAAWIDQHFSVDYAGSLGGAVRAIHHSDNDMWGFGVRTGLNTDWMLGKGWSLFGNAAASILFSKYSVEQHLQYGAAPLKGFDLDHDFYQNTPNFELALGIAWGQYFNKNKYHVGLRAAYEFHEWISLNNIRKFSNGFPNYPSDTVARGNFSMNGFSLSLTLDM